MGHFLNWFLFRISLTDFESGFILFEIKRGIFVIKQNGVYQSGKNFIPKKERNIVTTDLVKRPMNQFSCI